MGKKRKKGRIEYYSILRKRKDGSTSVDMSRVLRMVACEYAVLSDDGDLTLGLRIIGHVRKNHTNHEVVILVPLIHGLAFTANLIDIMESQDINVAPLMDRQSRRELVSKIVHHGHGH